MLWIPAQNGDVNNEAAKFNLQCRYIAIGTTTATKNDSGFDFHSFPEFITLIPSHFLKKQFSNLYVTCSFYVIHQEKI